LKRSFYPRIEGFRGLAVLLVLISHWIIIQYFPKFSFLDLGFLGVNFFFVLSGFLITEILLIEIYNREKPIQIIKNFFAKRTLRIFPIYYLTILVLAIFNIGQSANLLPWTLTYSLNIGENWFGVHEQMFMHIWSLCVEEQFYLIWPFILLVTKNTKHFSLIVMIIAISILFKFIIFSLDFNNSQKVIHSNLIAAMDALAVGGLLAYLKCFDKQTWTRFSNVPQYFIVLLLLVFWAISLASDQLPIVFLVFGRVLSAIIGAIIITKAIKVENSLVSKFLSMKSLKFLGKISYGVYLYHWILSFLLYDFFSSIWESINFESFGIFGILKYHKYAGSFIFFFITTFFVATLSFYVIEKPLLKLKRYF
jgi:peptidoglycan/LPS O-acetylase OafA/YrhL